MKKISQMIILLFLLTNVLLANDANLTQVSAEQTINLSFKDLYFHAHIIVKIVIWILVLFSVLTWAIFIYKFITYAKYFKILKQDRQFFKDAKFHNLCLNDKSLALQFYKEIQDELEKSSIYDKNLKNRIEQRLKLKSLNIITQVKKSVSFLASVGSSAPFIGLFGTVWGIMHSFINIAKAQNASLNIVAPGIAEALFATALGLVVAIPAVLFYNYLLKLNTHFSHLLNENIITLYLLFDRENTSKEQQ
ncbi:MotA/TolQ/ExbB proton channel family protein [Campylobacter sp. US33a]|uniref:MotA/TolQ/ExbB proton channel family protein n=1 Tax=Campylobacter sp. US33a TaxID=2498120 RepID=UPI001FBA4C38|nr:MotA/TolQ/ExbB proton channel family protein [Campylobacter sp. US33a]